MLIACLYNIRIVFVLLSALLKVMWNRPKYGQFRIVPPTTVVDYELCGFAKVFNIKLEDLVSDFIDNI